MTWFKVDDSFYDHPKVKAIPRVARKGAIFLWNQAGSWSCRYLTDGLVPDHMVDELGANGKDSAALVACTLWERVPGGYLFHDWADYQFTREQVETERAAARERMMRKRRGKAGSSAEPTPNVRDMFGGAS